MEGNCSQGETELSIYVVSTEAAKAGPWRVLEIPATYYGVYDGADRPQAIFNDLHPALLTAALLPGTGRDPLFQLHQDPGPEGYAVESGGQIIGHLAHFDDKLIDALHTVECLLRSPEALANLLEAAGGGGLGKGRGDSERPDGGVDW
jgi:hypothetical protein